jgi:predicted histone-like DNA-binding protein
MSKGALEGSKLYYPQVINLGRVSFDSLCEEVAEQSSLTSGDIKNCMDRLVNCLVRHLKEGRSVDCGDLGSFRINIRSTGADTPETYDAATMMRKPSVQYYLGKKLRDMQDTGVQYERYTPPSNE